MMVPLKLLRSCVFCLVLCVGSTGCVRVPEQAVVLSNVVGERIGDMQASHEKFVTAYFQLTRERLEDFITQRWVPTFLGDFVKEAQLIKELAEAQSLTDKEVQLLTEALQGAQISDVDQVISAVQSAFADPERGQIVLEFSEEAIKQIELKRKSLIDPINAFEAKTLDELRKAYSQLKQAQSTVTGHLSSIKEVTDAQDKILEVHPVNGEAPPVKGRPWKLPHYANRGKTSSSGGELASARSCFSTVRTVPTASATAAD